MKLYLLWTIVAVAASTVVRKPIKRSSDIDAKHSLTVSGFDKILKSRSRRSLTALLAAEVLFLERILAAQNQKNSRKPRKISRQPPNVNLNNNINIDQRIKTKHPVLSSPINFKFSSPVPVSTPVQVPVSSPAPTLSNIVKISQTKPGVSSLDPFVMLKAPDLSKNNYGEYELYQTLYLPGSPPSSSSSSSSSSSALTTKNLQKKEIVTFPPETISFRQPKKRKLHYGAYELYQLK